jgi:hypothetical protein
LNRNCGAISIASYVEEELFKGVEERLSFGVEDDVEFKALGVGKRVDCNASNQIAASSSGEAERERDSR